MTHCSRKVVAIVQARMGATTLPGKVLLDQAGEPTPVRVVDPVQRAGKIDEVVVATTTNRKDDPTVALCREHTLPIRAQTSDQV